VALGTAISGRVLRTYADARRRLARTGSAYDARRSFSVRPDHVDWPIRSFEEFADYRSRIPLAASRVSVLCVTQRPSMISAVVRNVARQRDVDVELVIVTNSDGFDPAVVESATAMLGRCTVLPEPPVTSLGACLNRGMIACANRFVAKMDDDDHYGEHYLADSLRAHSYAGAAVVGKHSYYADVVAVDARYLRFPGNEFRYSGTLAGGTLVIDRHRTGALAFEDRSLGEDRAFLRACHRRGLSTFSADRFGFVQHRGDDNTWRASAEQFLVGAIEIDPAATEHTNDGPA